MPGIKAFCLSGGLVLGLLMADSQRAGPGTSLLVGACGIICLAVAWWMHGKDPAQGELLNRVALPTVLLVLVGTGALGFANLGAREALRLRSPLPGLHGSVIEVDGTMATDPQPLGSAWGFALKSISQVGGPAMRGRLAVRSFEKAAPKAVLGDRVRLELKIAALDPDDSFDVMQARKGSAAEATLVMPVRVLSKSHNPLVRASNFFRDRMSSAAKGALHPNRAALVLGLVIGDDRALSARVKEDFRASGLSHLTAVSGANLAMVLGALALALGALKVSKRHCIAYGLACIVLFAVVTRWEPSVLRASVMAAIALSAFLFGREAQSLNTLAIAFFGLLLFDPMLLWSVGFQLSFAATAGILTLRGPLVDRFGAAPRLITEPIAIGLSAQVAVFPLIALHFEKLSVAAIPANLAAVGVVTPVTVIGLLGGVASLVSPLAAWPFMKVAGLFAWGLEGVARTFGRSDSSQISMPNFNGYEFLAACLGLGAACLWLKRRGRWARWPALIAAVVLLGALLAPAAGSSPAGLRVTFFDVGQGDAALVETPGGARMLIDGGPDPEVIAGKLRRRGLNRLDLVVATHLHADHAVGLAKVFRRFDVGISLHPGFPADLLQSLSVDEPLVPAEVGESIIVGDLQVKVLAPDWDLYATAANVAEGTGKEGAELNDASVVLRVEWAGECVLFTGDLEEVGQQALLQSHPKEIDCAVMKAPHHGSGRLVAEFVNSVDPEWVPISVGKNSYGHPSQKALKTIEGAGGIALRTDELGDVVIEITNSGEVLVKGS